MAFDGEKFGQDIVAAVKGYVGRLEARVAALEARPVPKYMGTWKAGTYSEGSMVTDDGSVWHCHKATEARPGTSADWQLCVKGTR